MKRRSPKLLIAPFYIFVMSLSRFVWELRVRWARAVPASSDARCCAVLLSWKRPFNIETLARSILKCEFVERLIISNNNPDIDLNEWVSIDDQRLTLVSQSRPTRQGIRFELSRDCPTDYHLWIDDDFLLLPQQINTLFAGLLAEPQTPHGIAGELRSEDSTASFLPDYPFKIDVRAKQSERVDHLTNVYAFSRGTLERALELCEQLGIGDLSQLGNGEDIILSFGGQNLPRLHFVGSVTQCLSMLTPGIATVTTHNNFSAERLELHNRLASLVESSPVQDR